MSGSLDFAEIRATFIAASRLECALGCNMKRIPKFDLLFPVERRRNYFSFSLSSLFVLTALVGMGIIVTQKYLRETAEQRKDFAASKSRALDQAGRTLSNIRRVRCIYAVRTTEYGDSQTVLVTGQGVDAAGVRHRFYWTGGKWPHKESLTIVPMQ